MGKVKKIIELELSYDIDKLINAQKVLIESTKKIESDQKIIDFQEDILTILKAFKNMNPRNVGIN
jgi:hypothetical protein